MSWRALQRATVVIRGAFDGVWLGAADDALLHAIDARYYAGQAEYADPRYNRSGLHEWEAALLAEHFSASRRLIVTAAGGGREVLALAKQGFEVLGFEPHPRLADAARALLVEEGTTATVEQCVRDRWPASGRTADGVIVGWGSYMLIRGRERRVRFLHDARASLAPGSPILLSFFVRAGDTLYFRTVARTGTAIARLRRAPAVELGDALAPNYVHYFTKSEIEEEMREAGWTLAAFGSRDYGYAVGTAA